MATEGDRMESLLTGKVYEVKIIKEGFAVLESPDGSNQVLTEKGNLKLFYKNIEAVEDQKKPGFFQSPKQP